MGIGLGALLALAFLILTGCESPSPRLYVGGDLVTHDDAILECAEGGGRLFRLITPADLAEAREACAEAHGADPWTYCHVAYEIGKSEGDGPITWREHVINGAGGLMPLDVIGADVEALAICEVSR